ncbi:hypothetical protein ACH3XX_25405 [Streptomyces scabiei]|uniref:hypothetical protein n=1 Tax=Streptomyces scabiei TaxID=1930 RepID=UPI00068B9386|nr:MULTISPECIES: hypothetical protein [Streptomyces]MBP5892347.1 hypothetical protein [Streptomyces sp. LBUM 1481]MBP5922581.1 hypothetical protein [Streptomyces sp. LBUM 1483]MDX2831440.1 hypothetical protein [Streptomyces scabiei]MDX3201436.1 hypothetical protein [Streptomyces scabiei]MDX3220046.1 hypothetical protein [Streptomyces scabiei]
MPGTVLLLAASPMGRGCLVDAASVLPVLAAVTPEVLSGTGTANVVELADPVEPQAVLTRLRAAATAPGPLTVYLTGQLQLDRRQRLVHLALARTTPATVRYTAFPWHWIVEELRLRAPGSTTLFVDLHADAEVWRQLAEQPLSAGPGVSLYGRVAPPAGGVRRAVALPGYMKALATILRSGQRPAAAVLHEQVVARAGGHGDLVLARDAMAPPATTPHGAAAPVAAAPANPAPVDPGPANPALADPDPLPADPHSAIAGAVEAGRHVEAAGLAARWEQGALREFGDGSEEVLHWREVRADLAMFAGDAAGSCETWLGVAAARLAAGRPARDPAVEAAVDRAHHQWGLVTDTGRALELGAVLVELRGRVPGRRAGALAHARQRLAELARQEDELRSAQHVPGQSSRSMSRRPSVVDR